MTEVFIHGKKMKISFSFTTHSYFKTLNEIRLNSKHDLFIRTPDKRDF